MPEVRQDMQRAVSKAKHPILQLQRLLGQINPDRKDRKSKHCEEYAKAQTDLGERAHGFIRRFAHGAFCC